MIFIFPPEWNGWRILHILTSFPTLTNTNQLFNTNQCKILRFPVITDWLRWRTKSVVSQACCNIYTSHRRGGGYKNTSTTCPGISRRKGKALRLVWLIIHTSLNEVPEKMKFVKLSCMNTPAINNPANTECSEVSVIVPVLYVVGSRQPTTSIWKTFPRKP